MTPHASLIDDYLAGPAQLRQAVSGMTAAQFDARPVEGRWTTRELICHLSDFEIVYADRIKRVLAEDEPPLRSGNPDDFAAKLAYQERDVEEELLLIEMVRRHLGRILRTLSDEQFQRRGIHSESGPLTIETLLRRVTGHVPHHLPFIEEKRRALGLP